MEPNKKKIIDLGILESDTVSGVKKISLVEEPAIMLDFQYFKKQNFVHPSAGEAHDDFISRCIPVLISEGKDTDQAVAVCEAYWSEKFAGVKVSFDYHDTLNTERGKELAKKAIADGEDVYVISAGQNKDEFMPIVDELGIDHSKVYATGSNEAKIEKIKELGIQKHYDNNQDVIDTLGEIGMKFDINVAGLPPYVDQAPKKEKPVSISNWSKDEYIVETIIGLAKELGIKEENLKDLFKKKFATANTDGIGDSNIEGAVLSSNNNELRLYKYEGRISSNSRSFCEQMVALDLYYTEESIKAMSDVAYNPGFGEGGTDTYSIWDFKGGANCKHFWSKFNAYQKVNGDVKLQRVGPVAGNAGKKPYNMPNHGYVETRHAAVFSFAAEEQQVLVGPAMVPDMKILRIDENNQKYWVKFSPETIKEIALKYFKEGRVHELNTDHEDNTAGCYIFESWLVETADDKANTLYGYNVPPGTWMISVKVEDPETWKRVKAGELRGFSVEGMLVDMEELEAMKTYERILKILEDK